MRANKTQKTDIRKGAAKNSDDANSLYFEGEITGPPDLTRFDDNNSEFYSE